MTTRVHDALTGGALVATVCVGCVLLRQEPVVVILWVAVVAVWLAWSWAGSWIVGGKG